MSPDQFLDAARVPDSLKSQEFGPWTIERINADETILGQLGLLGWPTMTMLCRHTWATLHKTRGEVVMEDSRRELSRHLPIWLCARGRVLITGLGLGCVVRGLLASPDVEHIDVVEIDRDILRVVGPEFANNPRVTLHQADALSIDWPAGTRWDCAWHDIWCEGDGLQVLHGKLICRYFPMVRRQGAWMLPRIAKRIAPGLIGAPRKRAA